VLEPSKTASWTLPTSRSKSRGRKAFLKKRLRRMSKVKILQQPRSSTMLQSSRQKTKRHLRRMSSKRRAQLLAAGLTPTPSIPGRPGTAFDLPWPVQLRLMITRRLLLSPSSHSTCRNRVPLFQTSRPSYADLRTSLRSLRIFQGATRRSTRIKSSTASSSWMCKTLLISARPSSTSAKNKSSARSSRTKTWRRGWRLLRSL